MKDKTELWPGLHTGELSLATGTAGGNTFLTTQQAIELAIGGLPDKFATTDIRHPAGVLVINGPDPAACIIKRIQDALRLWDLDTSKLEMLDENFKWLDYGGKFLERMDDDADLSFVEEECGKMPVMPKLVIIDQLRSITNVFVPGVLDEVASGLEKIAHDLDIAIMVVDVNLRPSQCRYIETLAPIPVKTLDRMGLTGEDRWRFQNQYALLTCQRDGKKVMPDRLLKRNCNAGGTLVPVDVLSLLEKAA